MNQQEYIAGFYGILIGFTLTELIRGVANTIKNLDRIKYYYPHGLFVVLLLFGILLNFFSFYRYVGIDGSRAIESWSPLLLMRNTFIPVFLCFFSFLLFPSFNGEIKIDFRVHYFKVIPKILVIAILLSILSIVRNIFIYRSAIFYSSNIILFFFLWAGVIGIRFKKDWIHYSIMILLLPMIIYWTLTYKLN